MIQVTPHMRILVANEPAAWMPWNFRDTLAQVTPEHVSSS